jgi:hypothetical protein
VRTYASRLALETVKEAATKLKELRSKLKDKTVDKVKEQIAEKKK